MEQKAGQKSIKKHKIKMYGTKKRTFKELQKIILDTLKDNDHTIYEIVKKTTLHHHTIQNQMIILKGQDLVSIKVAHNRFKLFTITEEGHKYRKKIRI